MRCATSSCGRPDPALNCVELPKKDDTCCPEFDCPEIQLNERKCFKNGVDYKDGEKVPDINDPCASCTCFAGDIVCATPDCGRPDPALNCVELPSKGGSCCPEFDCPNPESREEEFKMCMENGVEYEHKADVPNEDPCKTCTCFNGNVICASPSCGFPDPALNCVELPSKGGSCCPEFECPDPNEPKKSCGLKVCPANYDPVCGSNGETYGNECEMDLASCELNLNLTVASKGEIEICN